VKKRAPITVTADKKPARDPRLYVNSTSGNGHIIMMSGAMAGVIIQAMKSAKLIVEQKNHSLVAELGDILLTAG
jgi:hypothetical protein